MERAWRWCRTDRDHPRPRVRFVAKLVDIVETLLMLIYPSEYVHSFFGAHSCMSVATLNLTRDREQCPSLLFHIEHHKVGERGNAVPTTKDIEELLVHNA